MDPSKNGHPGHHRRQIKCSPGAERIILTWGIPFGRGKNLGHLTPKMVGFLCPIVSVDFVLLLCKEDLQDHKQPFGFSKVDNQGS
jgi:hypothetical protein